MVTNNIPRRRRQGTQPPSHRGGLRERGGLRCCGLGLLGSLDRRRLGGRGRRLGVRFGRRIRRGGAGFRWAWSHHRAFLRYRALYPPRNCHQWAHRYRAGSSPPAAGRLWVQLPHAKQRPHWRPPRKRPQQIGNRRRTCQRSGSPRPICC